MQIFVVKDWAVSEWNGPKLRRVTYAGPLKPLDDLVLSQIWFPIVHGDVLLLGAVR